MDYDDPDFDDEPAEPSDLGFDPYAGTYVDDDPVDSYDYYEYPDEPGDFY